MTDSNAYDRTEAIDPDTELPQEPRIDEETSRETVIGQDPDIEMPTTEDEEEE